MAVKLLVLSFATTLNLGLCLLVYMKAPSQWVNRVFALFALTVAGWTVGTYLGTTYAGTPSGLLVGRWAFAMGGLSAYGLLVFLHVFPASLRLPRSFPVKIFGVLAGALALAALSTPWIVATQTLEGSKLKVEYGPLYPIFGAYVLSCIGYSLFFIIRKIRVARGVERHQLKYLFMGLLVPGLLATVTNLLIPLAFGTSQFSHYGALFNFMMIAMIAHAIVRYRLMNIRLVIRRGVVLLLAAAAAGGVFVGLLSLTTTFLFPLPRDLPLSVEVALVLLIALVFQPLRRCIQTSFDRYLYRESYDYQRTIREASRTFGSTLDLKPLLNYLSEVIGRTLRPEFVTIYIKDLEGQAYVKMATKAFLEESTIDNSVASLSTSSPLVDLLSLTRVCLVREDLERGRPNVGRSLNEASGELNLLGGEAALPVLDEDELTGFVIVAPKLSGDPYFSEDIDLLSTLIGQAAIAIKNAQLYRQVALVNEYVTNIVATMESGVVAVDTNGKITLFNPSAERITGLNRQGITSQASRDLPAALAHPLEATLADGEPRIQTETMVVDTTGRYTPVSYSTHALRDRKGNVLGSVGVFSDLSRLKELEGEKRRAERLASIGALASGIGHEIKNPLVAIKTFAELLPDRFTEKDFREEFSQVVIHEIGRIDDLVARLRGLAVPSARILPRIDLRDPIEETLILLRGQLDRKRISVKRLYEKVLPLVPGNAAQLKQLFLNLFMNSLEAMAEGGQLTIRLARGESPSGPSLLAEVTDSGSGIPREIIGKVFDPFVTSKPGGSGLGLAICRGIVDAHRATIQAKNNPHGPGTTVAIEFFVAEEMLTAVGS